MENQKIRIIYMIADAGFSGGPIQLYHLVSSLDRDKFDPIVIAPEGNLEEKIEKLNIPYHVYTYQRGFRKISQLRKIVKPLVTDNTIIHCHGVRAGYSGRRLNRRLKLPLIYTEHNWTGDYKLPQNWRRYYQLRELKKLNKFTTHTVAVSKAVQDFLLEKKIVNKDDVSVIYNGVDFKSVKRRTDFSPVVIGTIASLHKRKGLVYLFEALAKLKKSHKDKKFILKIIGSGPQESYLKQHSVDLDINFDIQWIGEAQDLEEFWSSINIYVQPSLDESFGMAVAEAMGYKIPVVATKVGALPEVVGDAGLLVEPANADQLVKAIENIMHNQTIRSDNIEKAYKQVRKNFTIAKMAEKYQKLYKNIIN